MDVQSRVQSLYRAGQREEAVSLARESLKNDEVTGVVIGEKSVAVKTTNFVGTQSVAGWDDGEVVVADEGEYRLRDDESVSFSTRTLADNVFTAIDEADDGNGPPGGAGSADGDATGDPVA